MRYWHMRFRRLIRSFCRSIGSHIALSQWSDDGMIVAQTARKLLNKVKTEFFDPVNIFALQAFTFVLPAFR